MWHHTDNMVQEQQEIYGVGGATAALWRRQTASKAFLHSEEPQQEALGPPRSNAGKFGTRSSPRVQIPTSGFGNWHDFKRHCDAMEAHPLEIFFCDRCGDFFVRRDSHGAALKEEPPSRVP